MSLYKAWIEKAYDKEGKSQQNLWDIYTPLEQTLYQDVLKNKMLNITTTVEELAAKHGMTNEFACGFIDGINECLVEPIQVDELEPTSEININIVDFETLFKKMVEYKAEHLFNLPEWDDIFDIDKRKALFEEQRRSKTFVRADKKVGRNDPCLCGSEKKFKFCCGA